MKHLWILGMVIASGCGCATDDSVAPAPAPAPVVEVDATPYAVVTHHDATRCGGVAVIGLRGGDAQLTADDGPLANLIALPSPTGLDFTDEKAGSVDAFQMWISEMTARGTAATEYYVHAYTAATDAAGRARAGARLAQSTRWFADALAHVEIPVDVRTGEFSGDKEAAFCLKMTEVAKPIYARAEAAAHQCAAAAAQAPSGWWSAVCK